MPTNEERQREASAFFLCTGAWMQPSSDTTSNTTSKREPTTPTNDERREVAERLRKTEPSDFGTIFDVIREIGLCVNPDGGNLRMLPLELAALIEPEERTCRVELIDTGNEAAYEHYEHIAHCHSCHHEFGYVLYNEDGDTWQDEKPNYCPNCGARVVKE